MIIDVSHYGILPRETADNTLALRRLLEELQGTENVTLLFGAGAYHFHPEYAAEQLLFIPNHDEDALKRIAFLLTDYNGLTLIGDHTQFIFHPDMIPFYLYHCANVTITGISVDYAQPIYSEATILSATEKQMTLAIQKDRYPFVIENGQLFFPRGTVLQPLYRWLEMDAQRNAPVYATLDLVFGAERGGLTPVCEEVAEGVVRLTLKREGQQFLNSSRAGNKLILRHHLRTHPCFYLAFCRDVQLWEVNVYHASGMAFIAQHTHNVTLEHFDVKINPENPRIFTATADATHFVYCSGTLRIEHCLFENQLDDPVNIHGIYARIDQICSEDTVIVQLVHEQQKGVWFGQAGQTLRVLDNETMLGYHEATIGQIRALNKDFIEIRLCQPCPDMQVGHVLENLAYRPDVVIAHCVFRNNRARGLLLTSAGSVLVEDNDFSVPGAAILIEGDSNNWFESGATTDVTIRNNRFNNCSYVPDWGHAPIQVTPSTRRAQGDSRFHRRLVVQNNIFYCFDARILYARHIEEIDFLGNEIIQTEAFPPLPGEAFHLEEVLQFRQGE